MTDTDVENDILDLNANFNAWGQQIDKSKSAYKEVRQAFRNAQANDILFAFSPSLRADLLAGNNNNKREFKIGEYFPDIADVDVISCTWYAGGGGKGKKFKDSRDHFKFYIGGFAAKGKTLAIDELGVEANDTNPQKTLDAMLDEVQSVATVNKFEFEYLTYFLGGGRGNGITSLRQP